MRSLFFLIFLFVYSCGYPDIDTVPDFNEVANELGAISVQTNKDLEKLRILKGGCWSFDEFNSTISANIVLDRLSEYYIVGFRPIIKL